MDLREVTELGITQDLLDLVPTECKYCGSTLDVNEVLTRYMCLNPYCKGKLQSRLVVFASELGVGGLDTSAFSIFNIFNILFCIIKTRFYIICRC